MLSSIVSFFYGHVGHTLDIEKFQSETLARMNVNEQEEMVAYLATHGFLVLQSGDVLQEVMENNLRAVEHFFHRPLEHKRHYVEPHKDALLPPPNKGYVEGLNKEYLKIKLPSHLSIPTYPDDVKPSFQKAQTSMLDLMLHILTAIASSKGDGENSCIPDSIAKEIRRFTIESSSLSVIHYFDEPTCQHNLLQARAKHQVNEYHEDRPWSDTNRHEPLGDHIDTGLMTAVVIGTVKGLEVYDKVSQTYFSAEETLQKGDIVILCGRKLEMIVDRNSGIVGTPHRVRIDKSSERLSQLFFMDIPSGVRD